jgi:hypothetical protein
MYLKAVMCSNFWLYQTKTYVFFPTITIPLSYKHFHYKFQKVSQNKKAIRDY